MWYEILRYAAALALALFGVLTLGVAKDLILHGPRKIAQCRQAGYGLKAWWRGSGLKMKVDAGGAVHFRSDPGPPPYL